MDVSIGAKNGASAVPLMRDAIRAVPQLRPLCLTVKAMLREAGVCAYVCICVCVYVCVGMCVYVCVHVCKCVCLYVCVCICV